MLRSGPAWVGRLQDHPVGAVLGGSADEGDLLLGGGAEHGDRERQAPGQMLGDPRHHLPALRGRELAHLGAEPERRDAVRAVRDTVIDLRRIAARSSRPCASKNA